jgi:hypothetical protein
MREKNARSDFTARRNFQAKEDDIEIGQKFRKHRQLSQHGGSATTAQNDGEKTVMQEAAK